MLMLRLAGKTNTISGSLRILVMMGLSPYLFTKIIHIWEILPEETRPDFFCCGTTDIWYDLNQKVETLEEEFNRSLSLSFEGRSILWNVSIFS